MKKICAICEKEYPTIASKIVKGVGDDWICKDCLKKADLSAMKFQAKHITTNEVFALIDKNTQSLEALSKPIGTTNTKKECVICNKGIGMLSSKVSLSDGYVCGDCLKSAGISVLTNNLKSFNTNTVKGLINRRIDIVNSFKATKKNYRVSPY